MRYDHKYTDIVIEKQEKGLTIKNPTLVTLNHNPNEVLGSCIVRVESGMYVANFNLTTKIPTKNLFPSIGYTAGGSLIEVGLCVKPNVDPEIKALGEQG